MDEKILDMDEKIKELAKDHKIPEGLLKDAIAAEKEKVVLQNRRMSPILIRLIEQYAESSKL
jgi:hypothetical protein